MFLCYTLIINRPFCLKQDCKSNFCSRSVLPSSPGLPQTQCVNQAGLELTLLLCQCPRSHVCHCAGKFIKSLIL